MEWAREPTPDPARGIFETVLVVDGKPVLWERHRERLAASATALYGVSLPAGIDRAVAEAARGHGLARLRLDLGRDGHTIAVRAVDPGGMFAEVEITPVASEPHGPHKLSDRRWLERIEARVQRPLLVSGAGTLWETSRANVFLLRDGVLATPPLDGAILPGVMRGVLLAEAAALGVETREQRLTLEDLGDAEIVLLTNSIRLAERSTLRPTAASAALVERLTDRLSQHCGRRAAHARPR